MNQVDLITVIALLVFALIGFFSGFGRSLRHFTGGIVGIIISVFVCAACGGMVLGTDLVGGWVVQLNAKLGEVASFFEKIQVGVIIFYIAMFLIVQVLRIIVVKFIAALFEADNGAMKVVNRVLGAVFVAAVLITFTLLVFAVFKLLDDTSVVMNLLEKIEGSFLKKN